MANLHNLYSIKSIASLLSRRIGSAKKKKKTRPSWIYLYIFSITVNLEEKNNCFYPMNIFLMKFFKDTLLRGDIYQNRLLVFPIIMFFFYTKSIFSKANERILKYRAGTSCGYYYL